MRWFNNLNATPRLMISFGLVLALTLGICYLGITNLATANDRLEQMYHMDLIGLTCIEEAAVTRMSIGRSGRDAILNMREPAAVEKDKGVILDGLATIHDDLDAADKLFYSPDGIAQLHIMHGAFPDYEKSYHALFERVDAKDLNGARAALEGINKAGTPLFDAIDATLVIKKKHAKDKFDAGEVSYQSARLFMLSIAAIALVLGAILAIVIARGFAKPLRDAVEVMRHVADGDMTVTLQVETKDELGRMAGALNEALERMRSTLQEVAENARNASASSQELAASTEAIAGGAQEQAASLEETSASLEEITAAVRQSADNAKQASQLATGSKDSAERGQEVVTSAITAMTEINVASARIAEIISTIDEIAFQTNLLAVNAAVEAARAGEEGRGFAVVASEVRSLAQRSAGAAKEIKTLIQDSLRKVERGSELVNRCGETLQSIVGSVRRVTDIVGEIAAAAAEQSTGIEQVNTAMTQMDRVTQSNSAQTEELSSTAQALSSQSASLLELVGTFVVSKDRKGKVVVVEQTAAKRTESQSSPFRSPAKTLATKAPAAAKSGAPLGLRQPAMSLAAAHGGSSDAGFEDF